MKERMKKKRVVPGEMLAELLLQIVTKEQKKNMKRFEKGWEPKELMLLLVLLLPLVKD